MHEALALPIPWAQGSNPQHHHAQGLIGAWPCWEGSGNVIHDVSGNQYDAIMDTPNDSEQEWIDGSGPLGVGFDFPFQAAAGNRRVARVTRPERLNEAPANNQLTVMCFAKTHSLDPLGLGAGQEQLLVSQISGATGFDLGYDTGTGQIRFRVGNGAFNGIVGSTAIQLEQWNHVAGVFSGGGQFRVFLNGALNGTGNVGGNLTTFDLNQPLTFGDIRTVVRPSDSSIADIRIYNRALSDVEIADIAANPSALYTADGTLYTQHPRLPVLGVF